MSRIFRQLRARVKYRRHAEDLAKEIELHRELIERDAARGGAASTDDARYRAARVLGNTTLAREDARGIWIARWQDSLLQDARCALRMLRRNPGFAAAAIAMLTLGITCIAGGYTVYNGLFVRGWDVPDGERVFSVATSRTFTPEGGAVRDGLSLGAVNQIIAEARAADYVGSMIQYARLRQQESVRGTHMAGVLTTGNFASALQLPMHLGTPPQSGSDGIVISYGVWRSEFGSDPNVIGRRVWASDFPATIAGVTGQEFNGLGPMRLGMIMPFSAGAYFSGGSYAAMVLDGVSCCVAVAGRLRAGYSLRQAEQELQVLIDRYRQSVRKPALTVALTRTAPMAAPDSGDRRRSLVAVLSLVAAGLVLIFVLTCSNVGNLFLARSLRRRREIAVRLSLGATRARVVRQLVTEGLLVASIAGAFAFALTRGVPIVLRTIEDDATAAIFASDWRVGAFAAVSAAAACLLVSLAPALQATRIVWRGGALTLRPEYGRGRGIMLGVQVAIACTLVLSATLITRGITRTAGLPTDFALQNTVAFQLEWPSARPDTKEGLRTLRRAIEARFSRPDARGGTIDIDVRNARIGSGASTVSRPDAAGEMAAQIISGSTSAMRVLDLALERGRWASSADGTNEAVVNAALAKRLWRNDEAIGRQIRVDALSKTYTVVGIARDAHLTGLGDIEAAVHLTRDSVDGSLPSIVAPDEDGVGQRIASLVRDIDPDVRVSVQPLAGLMTQTIENARLGAVTASALGTIALLLAALGIFGVFAYLVEERRREIGIRLSLGATRRQVRTALFLASRNAIAGGLGAGLVLSMIAGFTLRGYLFGLSPIDPMSYVVVAAILTVTAIIATAVPIRRALKVDPAVTLRQE